MFWTNLQHFYATYRVPLDVVAYIVVALVLRLVLGFVIDRIVKRIVTGVTKRHQGQGQLSPIVSLRVVQRTQTLGSVLKNVLNAVIVIVTVLLVITKVAPGITGAFSLITAALGAGLGFGAQGIVKDVLNGLSMVADDQLGVGDVVDLGPATGVVEAVGIRTTQIRDVTGTVWFVHNGDISRIGNQSLGWSRVILDLAVPVTADVTAVQDRMLDTATAMAADPAWSAIILEAPQIWGVESISGDSTVIRLVVKTRPGMRDDVARDLRARLKAALDAMGVRLPALNSVVLTPFEDAPLKATTPKPTRK
ncbi:MAG: mechanosensitive ion channel domain-containing protein [Actinomycetota bacterium]